MDRFEAGTPKLEANRVVRAQAGSAEGGESAIKRWSSERDTRPRWSPDASESHFSHRRTASSKFDLDYVGYCGDAKSRRPFRRRGQTSFLSPDGKWIAFVFRVSIPIVMTRLPLRPEDSAREKQ